MSHTTVESHIQRNKYYRLPYRDTAVNDSFRKSLEQYQNSEGFALLVGSVEGLEDDLPASQ